MIIDSHQHVNWHGKNEQGLFDDMEANRVDQAWILTWEIPPNDYDPKYTGLLNPIHIRPDGTHPGITLGDILAARDRYPERVVAGYCPDPAKKNAPALLEAAAKIHDVKVCGEWKFRMLIDDPRSIELFRMAGSLRMPVVLHLDIPWFAGKYQQEWYGGTVENLERAMSLCPQTQFIGHAPGFWREIAANSENEQYPSGAVTAPGRLYDLFEQYPNLHADLSAKSGLRALQRDPEHAISFVTKFSERLLFGRDYYGSELSDFLATLELPETVLKQIHAENALRLLGATS